MANLNMLGLLTMANLNMLRLQNQTTIQGLGGEPDSCHAESDK